MLTRTLLSLLGLVLMLAPVKLLAADYIVRSEDPQVLYRAKPELPSLQPYTRQAVLNKIGSRTPGSISTVRMVHLDPMNEFVGGDGRLAVWAARQRRNPHAIVLRSGYVTPQDIAAALGPEAIEETSPGVFVVRLPILVSRDATFHINGQVKALRLSEDAGAFLVNDGRLFMTDTAVLGWRESAGSPARYRYEKGFRPFILSWGGTELYAANTRFESLGYDESKSYGFSISQYTPAQDKILQRSHPTGWIIDSEFEDMWFGFYCYEADDVVIARNTYTNSIVYGIDPHDRSNRLIIAENHVSGTRKKHGIIISREVNNSWLFSNVSTGNALSGMVLDRQSSGNVVADNEFIDNGSDGLTLYESPDNIIWGNKSVANGSHGYRVRNSTNIKLYDNIAINNAYTGINGHAKVLPPGSRDLELDPYDDEFSMVIVGGRLVHNGGGPVAIEQPLSIEMAGVEMLAPTSETGFALDGVLGEYLHEVFDVMVRQKKAVVIELDNVRRKVEG